jgi:hypothetical protein
VTGAPACVMRPPSRRVVQAAASTLAIVLLLGGCGRAGPPRPPGPPAAVTHPRIYPAPDEPLAAGAIPARDRPTGGTPVFRTP